MTRASLTSILLCLLGFAFAMSLKAAGIVDAGIPGRETLASLYLLVAQDTYVALLTAGLIAIPVLARNVTWPGLERPTQAPLWAVVAAGFLLALVFRIFVHHSFDLSLDEFMPTFQAKIFQSGRLLAPLSPEALAANKSLQPFFTYVNADHGLWSSYYRPVHAGLIAVFSAVAHADLLNPVLVAISLWAMADIARRCFPDHPSAPYLAAVFLLVSPQFLAISGAGFAFTAHLAFNLVWLAFFLKGTFRWHCAAAAIGFFAVGLHQVHVHPLFVTPFLAAMLLGAFGPRFVNLIPYAISYGLALPIWMMWPEISVWLQTGDTSILPRSVMQIDYIKDYFQYTDRVAKAEENFGTLFLATNVLRFWLWVCPALLVLTIVALRHVRHIGLIPVLAGLGFVLMFLVTHVLMPNQMHSWGSRYYHPVLGNVVLFALGGFYYATRSGDPEKLGRMVGLTVVASAVVLMPIRALQIEAKVGPRADVQNAIANLDADVVFIAPRDQWFSADFLRNEPDLSNRPLLASSVNTNSVEALGTTHVTLGARDLAAMGLPRGSFYEPGGPN